MQIFFQCRHKKEINSFLIAFSSTITSNMLTAIDMLSKFELYTVISSASNTLKATGGWCFTESSPFWNVEFLPPSLQLSRKYIFWKGYVSHCPKSMSNNISRNCGSDSLTSILVKIITVSVFSATKKKKKKVK